MLSVARLTTCTCSVQSRSRRAPAPAVAGSRKRTVVVQASDNSDATAIPDGATVRVTKPVKIYHAPKLGESVELEGQEGKVVGNAALYKGKVLSANLPYKVQFNIDKDGSPVKLLVHLSDEELTVIS